VASPEEVKEAKDLADAMLLNALGASPYMHALALMRELEDLVRPLDPGPAAEALSAFSSLVAFRYAERRRDA
jgi:hypothetical protein